MQTANNVCDDGNVNEGRCGAQALDQFPAIHNGHGHVGDDQVRYKILSALQCLAAVTRQPQVVLVTQMASDEKGHIFIILDDKHKR